MPIIQMELTTLEDLLQWSSKGIRIKNVCIVDGLVQFGVETIPPAKEPYRLRLVTESNNEL